MRKRRAEGTTADRPTLQERALQWYKHGCYRLLGERFDTDPDDHLAQRLKQAGYGITPGMYNALLLVTCLVALAAGLPVYGLLFALVVPTAQWYLIMVILAGLTALVAAGAFPFALGNRIANRGTQLSRELPFSLSELSVMASIGLSPIELVRRMAQRPHDPTMTGEFRRVVYKTDVQGRDLVTALSETAKESASDGVRRTFWDLANMIHQGGDLDQYLRSQSDQVLSYRRQGQKDFIERLGTYADMYVTLVLIGVMFLGVGAFLLDSFGSTAGGLTADQVLLLLTYGLVPFIIIVMALLLGSAHGKSGGA